MPEEMLTDEKNDRINRVLKELGLETCADTRIGTEFLRGVSGGEKKRTCIGITGKIIDEKNILKLRFICRTRCIDSMQCYELFKRFITTRT